MGVFESSWARFGGFLLVLFWNLLGAFLEAHFEGVVSFELQIIHATNHSDYKTTKNDHSDYRSFGLQIIWTKDNSDYRSFRLQVRLG